MITRSLRQLLVAVNGLDRGTGVTLNRITSYMREIYGYIRQTSVMYTLQRAVREGYLRLNDQNGRYYPRRASRMARLLHGLPHTPQRIEWIIPRAEPNISVLPTPVIVMGTAVNAHRRGQRANMHNRNRRVVAVPVNQADLGYVADDENGRESSPPRRLRFGQSVMANVSNLTKSDQSSLNLETKESLEEAPIVASTATAFEVEH